MAIDLIILFYIGLLILLVSTVVPVLLILFFLYIINKKYKSIMLFAFSITFIFISAITLLSYLNTELSGDPPSFSNTNFISFGYLSLISLIILLIDLFYERNKYLKEQKKTKKKKKQR